jgi:hypothetical protein
MLDQLEIKEVDYMEMQFYQNLIIKKLFQLNIQLYLIGIKIKDKHI